MPPRMLPGGVDTHPDIFVPTMIALILAGTSIGGCATMRDDDAFMRSTDRAADYPVTIIALTSVTASNIETVSISDPVRIGAGAPAVSIGIETSGKTEAALKGAGVGALVPALPR